MTDSKEQEPKPPSLADSIREKIKSHPSEQSADEEAVRPMPLDDETLVGAEISGRYKLLEQFSQDSTTITFIAEHMYMDRKVRIKLLRAHLCTDKDAVKKFSADFRESAMRQHTGECDEGALDFGIAAHGRPYAIYVAAEAGILPAAKAEASESLADKIKRKINENQNQI